MMCPQMLLNKQIITVVITEDFLKGRDKTWQKICFLEKARQSNETNVSLQLLLSEKSQAILPKKQSQESLYALADTPFTMETPTGQHKGNG